MGESHKVMNITSIIIILCNVWSHPGTFIMVTHKAGNRFFCKVSRPRLLQCMVSCIHSASWCVAHLVVDTSGHCYYSAQCHAFTVQ